MKKILLSIVICSMVLMANAQTTNSGNLTSTSKASVEKSIFEIQTGFLGIWISNEVRLSNAIALRSELGFAAQINGAGFLLTPMVTLEPRWYYNLKRRKAKSRRIDGNSGNFISLQTSYFPGGLAISSYGNINIKPMLTISSLWGIKRNIGNHFNYEVAVGPGYTYRFPDKYGYGESDDYSLNIFLRIGYRF
jgi:hypothetical protein